MRKFYKSMCCVLVCCGLLSAITVQAAQQDQVALVVNDDVVTLSELQKAKHRMQQSGAFSSSDQKIRQQQLIDYIIDERIQMQQAKLSGLTVTDKEVTESLQRVAAANHIPLAALYQSLQQSGISLNEYREEMKKRLLLQKLAAQHITKPPKISEQEVDYFLKKQRSTQQSKKEVAAPSAYHLHDYVLLFKNENQSDRDELMQRASELRSRLVRSESLQGLTHEFEDLGMRSNAELPDVFLQEAKQLKPNQFSKPFVVANGVHVLKLVATNAPVASALPVMSRDQVKQMVLEEKLTEIMRNWVRELRAQSYIEIKVKTE